MLSVPIILLIVAAVVGTVGIAFAIVDAVKSRRRAKPQEVVEKPRWGEELGFTPNAEAVEAAISQWSHGAAVDDGLSDPEDPVVGEFAGHPAIVFGQDDGLIVAVQRDVASDVVVEIHPQEPVSPEEAVATGRATDLQVYASDVDAMIRATDNRLVELLNKHPQDLAMAWAEGYWSAALLPLGDDGVDINPNSDQYVDEQLPYVLNWLANLNDALRVLPPREGEEEEIGVDAAVPSRPQVDRTDEDSVPADADLIAPEESEFYIPEPKGSTQQPTQPELEEETTGEAPTDTDSSNVIPFAPFTVVDGADTSTDSEDASSVDASPEDAASASEDTASEEAAPEDADEDIPSIPTPENAADDSTYDLVDDLVDDAVEDAVDEDDSLHITEEAAEYLETAEGEDASQLEWVEDENTAEVEPDHVDEEDFITDWEPEEPVEAADLSAEEEETPTEDHVTEADFVKADDSDDDSEPDTDAEESAADVAEPAPDDEGTPAPEPESAVEPEPQVEDTPEPAPASEPEPERSPFTFVRPVATPEETGPIPVINAQETYYPSRDEEPEPEEAEDDGADDFIVDVPQSESEPAPAPESEPEPAEEPATSMVKPYDGSAGEKPAEAASKPETKPAPEPEPKPAPQPEPEPAAEPEPEPAPEPTVKPAPAPKQEPEPEPAEEKPTEDFIESSGSHVADDPEQATMRTGEFPIIRPTTDDDDDEGGRHVLDEGERPAWFVPGKSSRRSRSRSEDE